MSRSTEGVGCLAFIIVFLLVNILLGGICTQYVVEFWGSYIKETVVDVPFFPCAIAGLFLGEIIIPLAVFTWIMSFVL